MTPTPTDLLPASPVIQLLRDGVWQSVAVFLTVLVLLSGGVRWLLTRPRKAVTWSVVSVGPLVAQRQGVSEKFRVLYGEKQVQNPTVALVDIRNSGNQPIPADHIEEAISIVYGVSDVLQAGVVDSSPPGIWPVVVSKGNYAEVEPRLLNEKDRITVLAVVEGHLNPQQINVSARIQGVRQVRREGRGGPDINKLGPAILPVVTLAAFSSQIITSSLPGSVTLLTLMLAVAFVSAGLLWMYRPSSS